MLSLQQRGLSWYADQEETLFRVVLLSNRCASGAAPGRLNSKDLPLVQVANPSLTPILQHWIPHEFSALTWDRKYFGTLLSI